MGLYLGFEGYRMYLNSWAIPQIEGILPSNLRKGAKGT